MTRTDTHTGDDVRHVIDTPTLYRVIVHPADQTCDECTATPAKKEK